MPGVFEDAVILAQVGRSLPNVVRLVDLLDGVAGCVYGGYSVR